MKRIVTMQDISCLGKCSLTVIHPVISAMGVECAVLPTALLSTHTAFPAPAVTELTGCVRPILDHWQTIGAGFDGILTGYLASEEQAALALELIDRFGENAILVHDPAMADHGRLYAGISPKMVDAHRELCRRADLVIPNLTEACLLTGRSYSADIQVSEVEEMLRELFSWCGKFAFITGVHDGNSLGAIGYDGKSFHRSFMPQVEIVCAGTGDILSAAFLGAVMRGAEYKMALDIAVGFTQHAVQLTAADPDRRFYGVNFEPALPDFIRRISEL